MIPRAELQTRSKAAFAMVVIVAVVLLLCPVTTDADTSLGGLWTWGDNIYGQLGDGDSGVIRVAPEQSLGRNGQNLMNGVKAVAGGGGYTGSFVTFGFTVILRTDGTVWSMGFDGGAGSLGDNVSNSQMAYPVQVIQYDGTSYSPLTNVVAVAAGRYHALALKNDGTVWAWGSNYGGAVGQPSGNSYDFAIPVFSDAGMTTQLSGVVAIAASNFGTSYAVKADGTLWVWGSNFLGMFGNGATDSSTHSVPVQVSGLTNVIAVSAGYGQAFVLKSDGTVWSWGDNSWGNLGRTTATPLIPGQVSVITNIIAISSGEDHGLALNRDGYIYCWGKNGTGQCTAGLGGSTPAQIYDPNAAGTGINGEAVAISGGAIHSASLKKDGTIWTWGDESYGQLGYYKPHWDFVIGNENDLKQVPNLTGFAGIEAGNGHTLAIKSPWTTKTIDNSATVGLYSSTAVDAQGKIHISYYNATSGDLKYATNKSGSWVVQTAYSSGTVGLHSAIAVDANGYAHIAYSANELHTASGLTKSRVYYINNTSGSWSSPNSIISNNYDSGEYLSITVDNLGCVHIAVFIHETYNTGTGVWDLSENILHMTTQNATFNGCGSWRLPWINTGDAAGYYPSIKTGSNNRAHVSYAVKSGSDFYLKYATNTSGSWVNSSVDTTAGLFVNSTSLAIDPSGNVHIAYDNWNTCDLKYVKKVGGSWTTPSLVETEGCTANYVSLALDGAGRPFIASYDSSNYNLTVISKDSNGSWLPLPVDTANSVGSYPSIAVDSLGNPHVSYYDATNTALRYAFFGDSVPPSATVVVNSNATYTNNNTVTLTLTCDDDFGVGCTQMKFCNCTASKTCLESWTATEAFNSSKSFALTTGDGTKYVCAQFADNLDNWTSSVTDSIVLDQTAPSGSFGVRNMFTGSTSYTNTLFVELYNINCSDSGSGCVDVRFSNRSDDTGWSAAEAYMSGASKAWFLDGTVGPRIVYVSFQDAIGNWSSPIAAANPITFDQGAPAGTVTINADVTPPYTGAVSTTTPNVTLRLECTDSYGCAKVQLSNDNLTWSTERVISASPQIESWTLSTGDGTKTVYVRFADNSGNWTTATINDTIALDTSSPTGSISINNGDQFTKSTTVSLSLPCSDASTCNKMTLSNDRNQWLTPGDYAATKTGYNLTDGPSTLWSWGYNGFGQLGIGSYGSPDNDKYTPQQISGDEHWTAISSGLHHTLAIKPDGTLWAWGRNYLCQLGLGSSVACEDTASSWKTTPVQVGTDKDWMAVSAQGDHSLALKQDGSLWAWGNNGDGELGCGSSCAATNAPQKIGTATWKTIGGGYYHSLGIQTDGSLWAWGYNGYGALGCGSSCAATNAPQKIGAATWADIEGGGYHSLGIQTDGSLWAWGYNGDGELGCGSSCAVTNAPQKIGAATWTDIEGGEFHSLGIQTNGSLWAWGYNGNGELGCGSSCTETDVPQQIGAETWTDIAGGGYHSLGIQTDGSLWAWGYNGYGQLGDDSILTSTSPVEIAAGKKWKTASAGGYFTNAIGVSDTKYVFVKYQDSFGNWSSPFYDTIVLDEGIPTGSITILGADPTTSGTVDLHIVCRDSISRCNEMCIKNDDSACNAQDWQPHEEMFFGWSLASSPGQGSRNVYARVRDNALNVSDLLSDSVFLDNVAPVTTASPAGGSYSDLKTVELMCVDTGGTLCNKTYYCLVDPEGSCTPATEYISPILIDVEKDLWFYSTDTIGNAENAHMQAYRYTRVGTTLTETLSSQSILQNGSVDIQGQLTKNTSGFPPAGAGYTITLTITKPDASVVSPKPTTTTNSLGQYSFTGVNYFNLKGSYSLRVDYAGNGVLDPATAHRNLLVGSSAGYAVIVQGRISSEEGIDSHSKTAENIYNVLIARGFIDNHINYFSYDYSVKVCSNSRTTTCTSDAQCGDGNTCDLKTPGADAVPTKTGVEQAITTWAKDWMNGVPAPLYIILVDHGSIGAFHIDDGDTNQGEAEDKIFPADLDGWFDQLEADLAAIKPQALLEKRIVINGSCYSGSFISTLAEAPVYSGETLTDAGRLIITSAAENEESYKGMTDPDDGVRSGEYFLDEFFIELAKGSTFKKAFEKATEQTEILTRHGSGNTNSSGLFGDAAEQHPLLDDDGDGIGSNSLSTGLGDGAYAAAVVLGVGPTNAATNPAELVTVTPTLYVSSGATVTLYGIAENNAQVDSAWIEVRPPSKVLNPSGGTGQLERGLTPDSMIWNGANSRYEKSYTVPAESGLFEVFYYTQRSSTLEVSTTKQSIFYVDPGAGSNPNAPTAPTLLMPADSATTKTELLLEWDPGCTLPAYTEETSCTANNGTWSTDWSICTLPAYTDRTTCLANSGTWQLSWDADSQSVTYSVYIAEYGHCSLTTTTVCGSDSDCPGSETCDTSCDTADENSVYTVEQMTYPALYIMSSAGLKDLKTYWWKVRAVDPYGRYTESACRTFATDNTNSGVTVSQAGYITNGTNGPGIDGASIAFKQGGITKASTTSIYNGASHGYYTKSLASGTYDIVVTATGYQSKTVSSYTIPDSSPPALNIAMTGNDTTKPTVNISAGPANPTNLTSASFTFSGSDNIGVTAYLCSLNNGAYSTCTSPKAYSGLAAGARTFSVKSRDAALNESTAATWSWTIDTSEPNTTISTKPSNPSIDATPSFSFTSTVTGSTFECSMDSTTAYSVCTSPKTYTTLTSGSHTFRVRAVSPANVTDSTPASYTWTIDSAAPVTSASATGYTFDTWTAASPVGVTLSATDGSGIAGGYPTYCTGTVNTCTPGTAYSAPIDIDCTAGSVCITYVRYWSIDTVGNSETIKSSTVKQDLQTPTTTASVAGYTFGNWTTTSSISVTLTGSDGSGSSLASGYPKYCVDSANTCTPNTAYSTAISVTCASGSACTQYVRYQSRDNATNTENVQSAMVRQDLQTPTTTATATDYTFGTWTTTTPISVTLSVSDGSGSALASGYPKYCVDTENTCTPNTSYSTAIDLTCASGSTCTQYLRYQSLDSLNNTEAIQSSTVKQDLQSPADGTLTATSGNNQVVLSWSGFSDGGSGLATANTYKLVRATGATAPTDCSGAALYQGTGTSHTDTTAINGTEYAYRLCAYDNMSNVSAGATASATPADDSAPTAETVTPSVQSGTFVPAAFTLTAVFTESGSTVTGCEYTTNGANWIAATLTGSGPTWTCTQALSGLSGSLTLNMRATSTGGTGTASQISRTVDAVAPATIASATGYTFNTWTTTSPISVTLASGDGTGSGLAAGYPKYCVDAANSCTPTTSYSSAFSVTCASDTTCTQYVRYQTIDQVGNAEAVSSSTVKQESQAPAAVTNLAASGSTTTSVTLTWTDPSDNSGSGNVSYDARYRAGSTFVEGDWTAASQAAGEPVPPATGMTVGSLTCGTTYAFAIKTTDALGNVSVISNAATQASAACAPAVVSGPTASATEAGTFVDGTFTITAVFNDNSAAVSSCDYSLNNGSSWTAATVSGSGDTTQCQSTTATCTTGQSLTVLMRATNTGGTTSTGPLNRTCDAAAPTSTITSPADSSTITSATAVISGTASDTGSSVSRVEISINSSNWIEVTGTTNWSYNWTGLTNGSYTIRSRATDAAGNEETPGTGRTVIVSILTPASVTVSGRTFNVDGSAFTVKGVNYSPVPVGESPETMEPYGDYFTASYSTLWNRDLPLIQTMGANTISVSMWDPLADHNDFLDTAASYGLYVIAGYHINAGLDLSSASVRTNLINEFVNMVALHKNHPAILMWAIGSNLNDPNYYGGSSAELANLFSLIDAMADAAHTADTNHPVTAPMADYYFKDIVGAYNGTVSLDLWSINTNRGWSFGNLFTQFTTSTTAVPKPLLITEFGIDAWDDGLLAEDEETQNLYMAYLWDEIESNSNSCIGGVYMEYSDEWWKDSLSVDLFCTPTTASEHGYCGYESQDFPDGYANEEWWGMVRIIDNGGNPDIVQTRRVYGGLKIMFQNLPPATSVTLSADKTSPLVIAAAPEGTVTFTASASGSTESYEYKFWLYNPAVGQWTVVREYGSSATWSWTPSVKGGYHVAVYARIAGSPYTYEAIQAIYNYYVTDQTSATSVSLTADKPSPHVIAPAPEGTVTFTAGASGGTGPYEYKFWLYDPAVGQWVVVREYGTTAAWSWTPSVKGADYGIAVYARNVGSPRPYETITQMRYSVVSQTPASGVTLSASTSPYVLGSGTLTFTASASGGTGPYEYKFWLYDPAVGYWSVKRDYQTSATWSTWAPSVKGSYSVAVYARNVGSPNAYEAIGQIVDYYVAEKSPATSVALLSSKTSPQELATAGSITFTAGASGGTGPYEYKFWLYDPAVDDWVEKQNYGVGTSWVWTPEAAGYYMIAVYGRNQGSPMPYEQISPVLGFQIDP